MKEEELKLEEEAENENDESKYNVGSPTLKTAKTMVESNTQRRIFYNAAFKTSLINILIVISCIIDSEIRWYCKETYEDYFFN